MIIGLAGVARSGKDSFYNFCKNINFNNRPNQSIAFAGCLKEELDYFLLRNFNISSFTEDLKEKEVIRPMLVSYGMAKRQISNGRYWIDQVFKKINDQEEENFFITDVRFPNEISEIKKSKGFCIHIEREGVGPINSEELTNDPIVKEECDYHFNWPNFSEEEFTNGIASSMVSDFLHKQFLKQQTIP